MPKRSSAKPLPEPLTELGPHSFDVPPLLLSLTRDASGLVTTSIRAGGAVELTGRLVITCYPKPPKDETDRVFRVQSRNMVNIGSTVTDVLTDKVDVGDIQLPATTPSASQYRAHIGKEVMIYSEPFRSTNLETKAAGREYWRVARLFITLP